jgi:hypothetical protein
VDQERYADVDRITLVCDNLNTHDIASLYKAFVPQEVMRIANKIQLLHTPKHGSWAAARNTAQRDRLAVHNQRRENQTQAAVPENRRVMDHQGPMNPATTVEHPSRLCKLLWHDQVHRIHG